METPISTRYNIREIAGSTTTDWNYIGGGDGLAAIYRVVNGTGTLYWVAKDHLGSIMALYNQNGTMVEEYSYDPWGRRRNPTTWSYTSVTQPTLITRGFTGHEHLDNFGIINMNGRLYDPLLGRMFSPDNFVNKTDFSQSYNRYSYCLNNPLKYTDPSGYYETALDVNTGGFQNGNYEWTGSGWMDINYINGLLNGMMAQNIYSEMSSNVPKGHHYYGGGVFDEMANMSSSGNYYGGGFFSNMKDYDPKLSFKYYYDSNTRDLSTTNTKKRVMEWVEKGGGDPPDGKKSKLNDATRTLKYSENFFTFPKIKMDWYSTKTIYKGKASLEIVFEPLNYKPLSIVNKTLFGDFSYDLDGSFTFGNNFSFGSTFNGKYIFDFSFPTSLNLNSTIGTTITIDKNIVNSAGAVILIGAGLFVPELYFLKFIPQY